MKKKILSIIICGVMIISLTGCGKEENVSLYPEFKDEDTGIIVKLNEDVEDNVSLVVTKDTKDYSYLSNDSAMIKYVAYDISLGLYSEDKTVREDKLILLHNKAEVSIKIPDDFDKDNLFVYYIKDDKIEEAYKVEVTDDYAKFETTHFSTYLLVEETPTEYINDEDDSKTPESTNEVSTKEESKPVVSATQNETVVSKPVQSEVVEPVQETTPSCTPKKFSNKYTYVYETEAECKDKGNSDIYDVWDAGAEYDNVTTFGCEKIVDDCGNTYYGEYFNIWVGPGVDEYQKLYY